MQRAPFISIGLLLLASLATDLARSDELKDLYFGEALYYAHQGDFFGALERLDTEVRQHRDIDEPELDSLYQHMNDAEFSLGDFELRYRMHHRAGRAIRAVLEAAVDENVRNDAAYRLARIQFQKGQMDDAMAALDRIEGAVPKSIRDDVEFLRANVYLGQGRPSQALEVLDNLVDSENYGAFAAYNLGIAHLQEGDRAAALEQLDRAGVMETDVPGELAIRDRSNLVLGTILLEDGRYADAVPYLNRVRLDGPFSNQALLSAGWASVSAGDYQRAIVPWGILADREVTDPATQEAMLALPYAYGKLDIHGRAAIHYGQALDAFGAEVDKLNASIDSIRDGRFLEVLIREEIRRDEDWVIRLRELPDAPETYYLIELMASHDFQTGLQNYLDLADLRRKLTTWESSFDAYDDMIAIRRTHYEPLLTDVDAAFRDLDSKLRLRREQHNLLVRRRDDLLTMPRPEFLATPEETAMLKRLETIEATFSEVDGDTSASIRNRTLRLKGLIRFTLDTEYHDRLTAFDQSLQELEKAMAVVEAQYEEYVRSRQAAEHSYIGYDQPFSRLRAEVRQSATTVDRLMKRQGQLLEVVAIDELMARRSHLRNYGDKARFALADSYDRASQSQANVGEAQ
jgi:tetratricopeptide (TPR) repeat protein